MDHLKSAKDPAGRCLWGLSKLWPLETWSGGPEFLSFPQKHWPASDFNDHFESALEVGDGFITNVVAKPLSFLPRLNRYPLWMRLLRVLIWLSFAVPGTRPVLVNHFSVTRSQQHCA